MRLEALTEIALAVAQERTAEAALAKVARGLAQDPSVALARIWLVGPGDQCDTCPNLPECKDTSTCLHLVASAGTPVAAKHEDWSRLNGNYRRIPLSSNAKISRIVKSGTSELIEDLVAELRKSSITRPQWALDEKITSFAGQPLVFRGEVLGMLGVFLRAPLSQASFAELRGFADHAAVAIANARAFDSVSALKGQLATERDRLRVLLEVASAGGKELELRALIHAIGKALRAYIPHEWTNFALRHEDPKTLRLHTLIAPEGRGGPEGIGIPIDGSPAGRAFKSGKPFVANCQADLLAAIELDGLRIMIESYGIRSGCFVPLISRGEALGTIGFGSEREGVFDEASVDLLVRIASQIAPAVDNALAYERVEGLKEQLAIERDRFRVLLEVTNAVAKELGVVALFEAIRAALLPIVPHEWTHLALHDEGENVLRLHTVLGPGGEGAPIELKIPIDGNPAARAFTSKAPFVADTQAALLATSDHPTLHQSVTTLGVRSCCFVPLVSRGRALGTVGFGSSRERAFDAASVQLLVQIAAQIAPAVDNALSYERVEALKEQLAKEKVYLEDEIRAELNFDELVGQSKSLRQTLAGIETVAATTSTVLVLGETGTGKELVARAIHRLSGRGERTFVKLNCAAIPTGLLESELFGHEKGAFTGAVATKVGRFELAHKGSLFLDEIGEISSELQPKLLRVLQDQEFERLGGTKTIKVDVRVIAATNRDLAQMVAARTFRSDLYYRLNVFPVTVPPLRERRGDVSLLVRHFVERLGRRMGKKIETIPAEAIEALERHTWPGNVRELEHLIERSVILTKGSVLQVPLGELRALPEAVAQVAPVAAAPTLLSPAGVAPAQGGPLSVVEASERDLIVKALHECGWRVGGTKGAAARLGLSRTTLQSKMLRFGIVRPG